MPHNVLLVTSQAAFGELIRLTLEETGLYRVRQVKDGAGALACIGQNPYSLAILDGNFEKYSPDKLASSLRSALPGIKLMMIPPENNPHHPIVEGVKPDGLIFEPFFAPDLLENLAGILSSTPQQQEEEALPPQLPPWLEDLASASQALKDLLPSTAAHTALLINTQVGWISTGSLAQKSAREICASLVRSSLITNQSDLARYLKLKSDLSEHLIYATPIASGVLMALVFPPATPVTKINTQTRRTSQRLTQLLLEQNTLEIPPTETSGYHPPTAGASTTADLAFDAVLARLPGPEPGPTPSVGKHYRFPWETEEKQPEPLPTQETRSTRQTPYGGFEGHQTNTVQPGGQLPASPSPFRLPDEAISREPASIEDTIPSNPQVEKALRMAARSLDDTIPNLSRLEDLMIGKSPATDARMVGVRVSRRRNTREFAELVQSNQAYTCLLVPGLTTHRLNGELGQRLAEWIPQLCMAFGWKLEGLVVQRQYLQWSVEVPPAISPGNVVRVIRQQTSQRIYNTLTYVSLPRPGEDFWAPGYLVLSGMESPSVRTISEFIHQTRRRQALSSSTGR